MAFYDNLKSACREKGTSVSAAIEACGRSKSAATAWKNNRSYPEAEFVCILAEYLGVSTDRLLLGKEAAPQGDLDVDAVELAKEWSKLNKHNKRRAEVYIDDLLDTQSGKANTQNRADAQQKKAT